MHLTLLVLAFSCASALAQSQSGFGYFSCSVLQGGTLIHVATRPALYSYEQPQLAQADDVDALLDNIFAEQDAFLEAQSEALDIFAARVAVVYGAPCEDLAEELSIHGPFSSVKHALEGLAEEVILARAYAEAEGRLFRSATLGEK